MKTSTLQSILATNRKELAGLYYELTEAKQDRKCWSSLEDLVFTDEIAKEYEYYYHNKVNFLKKKIKKLVDIQMDVKFEIVCITARERYSKKIMKEFSGRLEALIKKGG